MRLSVSVMFVPALAAFTPSVRHAMIRPNIPIAPVAPIAPAIAPVAPVAPALGGCRRQPSMMSLAAAAATWCPTVGCFTSNALYLSPLMAVLERTKAGSLGDLNPLPAAITVLSSAAWLMYGLSISNPYITASNLPGLIGAIAGLVLLLPLMKGEQSLQITQIAFVVGSATILCLWTYFVFSAMSAAAISSALGLFASGLFVILCSSPLASMKKVIATRDATSIYAPGTAAQCANTALWTVYGFVAAKDVFVWGPNITGLLLGIAQLVLKLIFPSKGE